MALLDGPVTGPSNPTAAVESRCYYAFICVTTNHTMIPIHSFTRPFLMFHAFAFHCLQDTSFIINPARTLFSSIHVCILHCYKIYIINIHIYIPGRRYYVYILPVAFSSCNHPR